MPENKKIRFGPVALTTTLTTNIVNCTVTSLAGPTGFTMTQPYVLINHIHIVSKTTANATVSMWIGATGANAAGTEFLNGLTVAPNSVYDWYGELRLDAADYLVGGSNTATALTFEAEGEIGLV